MKSWVVCFDISDDKSRQRVAKLLGRHGRRVQRSVFELLVRSDAELDDVLARAMRLVEETDKLTAYPLCLSCREGARQVDGAPALEFFHSHVC